MKKVLFVSSEVFPLVKTGGLADVSAALPAALAELGAELRVLMPAYRGTLGRLPQPPRRLGGFDVRGQAFALWESQVPGAANLRLWLIECAPLYDRPGDPYHDSSGVPHADNAWRFGCFGEAAARLALNQGGVAWQPDVLHLNDWQSALAAVWTARAVQKVRTVFTIHNLAYQGVFARDSFEALALPVELWHHEALEFFGSWQFLKAGLVFSDAVTTVSPTYAAEIQTPAFGHGLDGVLRRYAGKLHGILNGIDDRNWNPADDPHLTQTYTIATAAAGKRANKLQLQADLGLPRDAGVALVAFIGRLAAQKGSDFILQARDLLAQERAQYVVLAAGDRTQEQAFSDWAAREPDRVAVHIGYDEALAHRIEAAADVFLMPSRFEPCGLNQMYSQRYGTIPVVRGTGGLADTVQDATAAALAARTATGVVFEHADVGGLLYGLRRALQLRADGAVWGALQRAGMARDFSWARAAREYLSLYGV